MTVRFLAIFGSMLLLSFVTISCAHETEADNLSRDRQEAEIREKSSVPDKRRSSRDISQTRSQTKLAKASVTISAKSSAETKYGTITGKFVLKGDVPKREFLIKNGKRIGSDDLPKNPEVCAVKDLRSDELIIDPKHKGIGNIFVYLREAPDTIHPDLKAVPKEKIKFDQVACRFVPHTLLVRTGQTVLIMSDDNCSHNFHTYPFNNDGENFTVTAKLRKGIPLKHEAPEKLPTKIVCDLHTWMTSWWLILDHPYAAITVAKAGKGKDGSVIGTFKIEKLPYGKYRFRCYHERAGYIGDGKTFKYGFDVTVDKPLHKLKPIEVSPDEFKEDH